MRNQNTALTVIGMMLFGALTVAHAQWLNVPDRRIPPTKDGKPNLTAPAPRINGKPGLSGQWQAERTPEREYNAVLGAGFTDMQPDTHDITKNVMNIFWATKPEDEPLQPEAAAIYKQRLEHPAPPQCLPASIPMALQILTFKIIQAQHEIVMLPEPSSTDSHRWPSASKKPGSYLDGIVHLALARRYAGRRHNRS